MPDTSQLLSPEQIERIKDRVDAHERVHIAIVATRYGEDVPALLADRAALQAFFDTRDKELCQAHDEFRQQVATELAGLLLPEPTDAQIWHPSPAEAAKAWAAKTQNETVRAAATRLGIDLSTPIQ